MERMIQYIGTLSRCVWFLTMVGCCITFWYLIIALIIL